MSNGHFEDLGIAWHETNVTHCEVCGRLIPKRAWVFADGERGLTACSEACETLYFDYVKPTYGGSGTR